MYKPQHIRRWAEQINYEGENFDDYYVAFWRFFRCSPLERANFKYIKEHLKDADTKPGQLIFPAFTDEVMMCRYYILVRHDADRALRMADMFAERIRRKGALDQEMEQRFDMDGIVKTWRCTSLANKVSMCREAGISIFAARLKDPVHPSMIQMLSERL